MVGATGFEPATTCSQNRCATRLRYAPKVCHAAEGCHSMCTNAHRQFNSDFLNATIRPMISRIRVFWLIGVFCILTAIPAHAGLGYARVPITRGSNVPSIPTSYEGLVRAPEFPTDLDWINTASPLRIGDLKGKFVLLDFWTYCCINCMHVLPDLKRLEAKYPNELVVIGVHSAKFSNEKDSSAIQNAVRRYQIDHPVVNDRSFQVWSSYGVKAWPTTVLINPNGYIISQDSGEKVFEPIDKALTAAIPYFADKGQLNVHVTLKTMANVTASALSFPGKISADPTRHRLIVSDTNHHRILIMDPTGRVLSVIGSGRRGYEDGSFTTASFAHPQGTVVVGTKIYVADTENHAIRVIDITKKTVTTLAGTGEQALTFNVPGSGTTVALNSPWDVAFVKGALYVAMAGSHQIWVINPDTQTARPYAGSGREGLQDGPLTDAMLAQPSGLATDGKDIFVADSEVSGIRKVGISDVPFVETIIGHGLFDFGDKDGAVSAAQLQHALGLSMTKTALYVADSYNHKIKQIILEKGQIKTIAGTGKSGLADGKSTHALFNEPGGLCVLDGLIYVADTNNHAIRRLNQTTGTVESITVKIPASAPARSIDGVTVLQLPQQTISDGPIHLIFGFTIPKGLHLNTAAPNAIQLGGTSPSIMADATTIAGNWPSIRTSPPHYMLIDDTQPVFGEWEFEITLYTCTDDKGTCNLSRLIVHIPYQVTATGSRAVKVTIPIN